MVDFLWDNYWAIILAYYALLALMTLFIFDEYEFKRISMNLDSVALYAIYLIPFTLIMSLLFGSWTPIQIGLLLSSLIIIFTLGTVFVAELMFALSKGVKKIDFKKPSRKEKPIIYSKINNLRHLKKLYERRNFRGLNIESISGMVNLKWNVEILKFLKDKGELQFLLSRPVWMKNIDNKNLTPIVNFLKENNWGIRNNPEIIFDVPEKIFEAMIKNGLDLNHCYGNTNIPPLMFALMSEIESYRDFAKVLIKKGADINKLDKVGRSILHLAIEKSRLEAAQDAINLGINVNIVDGLGITPLEYAVKSSKNNFIKLLINHGANVDIVTKSGDSLLTIATEAGNTVATNLLLEERANISVLSESEKNTILFKVLEYSPTFFLEFLSLDANPNSTKEGVSILEYLVEMCPTKLEYFEAIFKLGADPDVLKADGRSLFFHVLLRHSDQLAEEFIRAGANVDKKDGYGNSVIADLYKTKANPYANDCGWFEKLLNKSANISDISIDGTPLVIRVICDKDLNLAKEILQHTDPHVYNQSGDLFIFELINEPDLLHALIEAGIDPNSVNNNDQSLLVLSVLNGQYTSLETLLDAGADVNREENALLINHAINNMPSAIKPILQAGFDTGKVNGDELLGLSLSICSEVSIISLIELPVSSVFLRLRRMKFAIENRDWHLILNNDLLIADYTDSQLLDLEAYAATHGASESLKVIHNHTKTPLFNNVIDTLSLTGGTFVCVGYQISEFEIELIYKATGDRSNVSWVASKQDFENKTRLKVSEMINDNQGTYKAIIYLNNAVGQLLSELVIANKKPKLVMTTSKNHSCHIIFELIPDASINKWKKSKELISHILGFEVEVQQYDYDHEDYPEYGTDELVIIKASANSTLPKALGLEGEYVGFKDKDGIQEVKYKDVKDPDLWVTKKDEIIDFVGRQVDVVPGTDSIKLVDRIEQILPTLMSWQDDKDIPKLVAVKSREGRKEYYYSFSPKKTLAEWKQAARKIDFRTLFDDYDRVYKLEQYSKDNKDLYDPEFSKKLLIVLVEYDKIPSKQDLMTVDIAKDLKENSVFFGYGMGSTKYYSNINSISHMMIIGATQSGKSNFMNGFILSLLHNLDKVGALYLVDLKNGLEFARYEGLDKDNLTVFGDGANLSKILSSLKEVEALMYLREKYMKDNGIVKIESDPVFIVIDEYSQIELMSGEGNSYTDKQEIKNLLIRLGTRARASNIKLIIQTQDPSTVDSELKPHLMSRILMKTSQGIDMNYTLQDPDLARELGIDHVHFDQGRFVFEDYNNGDTLVNEIQFPYVDPAKTQHKSCISKNDNNSNLDLEKYKEDVTIAYPYLAETKILSLKIKNSSENVTINSKKQKEDDSEQSETVQRKTSGLIEAESKLSSIMDELEKQFGE